jgi:TusA-related sulfurtransferase
MSNVDLDCKGLNCPMPIVKISRAMKELQTGVTLTVTASDPSFKADVEAWVRKMNQKLVSFSDVSGTQTAIIEKVS